MFKDIMTIKAMQILNKIYKKKINQRKKKTFI